MFIIMYKEYIYKYNIVTHQHTLLCRFVCEDASSTAYCFTTIFEHRYSTSKGLQGAYDANCEVLKSDVVVNSSYHEQ